MKIYLKTVSMNIKSWRLILLLYIFHSYLLLYLVLGSLRCWRHRRWRFSEMAKLFMKVKNMISNFYYLLFKEVRKYISLFILLTLLSRNAIRRTIGVHLTFVIFKQKSTPWPQYLIWRAFEFMSNWWNVFDAIPISLWRRLNSSNNIIFLIKPKQFFELCFWIIRESIEAIFR